MSRALWIGRFQPFHKGHLDAVKQMEEQGASKLLLGIGSAQEKNTLRNPFTYDERKEIVDRSLKEKISIPYHIFPIPDFNSDDQWKSYITKHLGKRKETKAWSDYEIEFDIGFDLLYTGNPWVKSIFDNVEVKDIDENRIPISASNLRQMIADRDNLESVMEKDAIEYLEEINAKERIFNLIPRPRNPELATDAIIEYNNEIVLIDRANEPFGWALPGGFIDYGESAEDAVVREAKEETNLDFSNYRQMHFYSEPKGDPRRHIASIVFVGEGSGKLKPGDDAKATMSINPREAIKLPNMAFERHREMIKDYLERK